MSKLASGKSSETRDIPSERPNSVIQRLERLHASPEAIGQIQEEADEDEEEEDFGRDGEFNYQVEQADEALTSTSMFDARMSFIEQNQEN